MNYLQRFGWLFSLALSLIAFASVPVEATQWQWAVPSGEGRAYSCKKVRYVVVANHNMIEQGILEHPAMRRTVTDLGMADLGIVPGMDIKFDFHNSADKAFEGIVSALADESGYDELRTAPVVALGHSANATWVWNFAAWNPSRTASGVIGSWRRASNHPDRLRSPQCRLGKS